MIEQENSGKHLNSKALGVDGLAGDTLLQIQNGLKELRRLRGCLFELGELAAVNPEKRVALVLVNPQISTPAIRNAWESAIRVIKEDSVRRMAVWVRCSEGMFPTKADFPIGPDEDEATELGRVLEERAQSGKGVSQGKAADAFTEIFKVLLYQWLREDVPVTSAALGRVTGYSYPTVAKALKRLGPYLRRHSNRSVSLEHFPREEWLRLIHSADELRHSIRFANRGDQARSPESLLRRFVALDLEDIAVSGVEGARYYCPDLDLLGLPRLDLCVHSPHGIDDLSFVESIDPGLEQATEPGAARSLVIHFLRRPEPLFETREDGVKVADRVECLLDLHDARLDSQAEQLLKYLESNKKGGAHE